MPSIFIRDKPTPSSEERMLHKEYDQEGSVAPLKKKKKKKISACAPQVAWQ
jgi:hypothetical protein